MEDLFQQKPTKKKSRRWEIEIEDGVLLHYDSNSLFGQV